jgi:hypothetical protein
MHEMVTFATNALMTWLAKMFSVRYGWKVMPLLHMLRIVVSHCL